MNSLILLILVVGVQSWAETNGVWHHAEDIAGGVVAKDQQDITDNFTFINTVYLNEDVFYKGKKLELFNNRTIRIFDNKLERNTFFTDPQEGDMAVTGLNFQIFANGKWGNYGTYESDEEKNCKEILDRGLSTGDGIYTINPTGNEDFDVYCDMTTDGGGWTVLFRMDNLDGSHWGYNGIKASSNDFVEDSFGYVQTKTWGMQFNEWMVMNPGHGNRKLSATTTFSSSGVYANGRLIPGSTSQHFYDGYHWGHNRVIGSSGSRCRLSAGYDHNIGWDDLVHGVLCYYNNNSPLQLAGTRHHVSVGFTYMAR